MAPDGRFLFHVHGLTPTNEEAKRPEIIVVQHWVEELKARVPDGPLTRTPPDWSSVDI